MTDDASQAICATQFVPWFRAGFELPDGGSLGVADFPSSPWRRLTGTVTPQDGRARANADATTIASQGTAFAGVLRMRFTFVANAATDKTAVMINANTTGQAGLEITLDANGELTAVEGGTILGVASVGALTAGTVYFVEAFVQSGQLTATVATTNYGSESGVRVGAELSSSTVAGTTTGTYAGLRFTGGGSVDDVNIARCGQTAPMYQRKFFDDFERANSGSVGSAVMPAVAWTGDDADISIANGTVAFVDGGQLVANAGAHFANRNLRIRTSARFGSLGWLIISVNAPSDGNLEISYDIWRETATNVFIEFSGPASGSSRFPIALDINATYYVQFDIDENVGIVTFRSGSYDGPVLFAFGATDVPDAVDANTYVSIGNTWAPAALNIDEFSIDTYAP